MSEAYWLNIERKLDEIRHGDIMESREIKRPDQALTIIKDICPQSGVEVEGYINRLESRIIKLEEEKERLKKALQSTWECLDMNEDKDLSAMEIILKE